ncbi:WYL domain-containing protein [Brevibacterium sp. 50QC2O2]|jgi:proteasome accessory factor C|uniref:WYL domain-containing protein n=1 Tax=Brevibacterium TaxID=1696 RepID=UPI00211C90FB|nr:MULTISPECIES: WYL domain-containing protein [unclassified Brevibacterium]MCQ9366807.1 WYL domain-containing protein [Brevibacterium sp. 91QC2O2]MCQ9383957.1 WYL domain-containing protein [Brevibacterium sp. 68QC2CO]MCQ9388840.1 WYL domain-containing protein [Brevibacterium sp. 50QC2O2]
MARGSAAAGRLTRLLGLVPYLVRNQGVGVATAAEAFGITQAQLIDDLQLLFVSGRPGHMPDDLIEASWEGDRIYVSNAEEVSVPVRLSPDEARSLLVAVDYLRALPATTDGQDAILARLRQKIEAVGRARVAHIEHDLPAIPAQLRSTLLAAIDAGSGLRIDYYVSSRDELTVRLITPERLRLDGRWYIDAWCHDSHAPRTFAVDNVRSATEAPAPGVPEEASAERVARPAEEAFTVHLTLAPRAAWLADELGAYETEYDVAGPGSVRVGLRVFSRAWLDRFLLCHGRHLLAVEPAELARGAAACARATGEGARGETHPKSA